MLLAAYFSYLARGLASFPFTEALGPFKARRQPWWPTATIVHLVWKAERSPTTLAAVKTTKAWQAAGSLEPHWQTTLSLPLKRGCHLVPGVLFHASGIWRKVFWWNFGSKLHASLYAAPWPLNFSDSAPNCETTAWIDIGPFMWKDFSCLISAEVVLHLPLFLGQFGEFQLFLYLNEAGGPFWREYILSGLILRTGPSRSLAAPSEQRDDRFNE